MASDNSLPVVRCRNCGLVYVTHRPSEDALLDLYGEYHSRDGGAEDSWAMLMRDIFRESAGILDAARSGIGPGRLLDVGCGFGDFVALMRERGWGAEGLDPSPAVAAAAAGRGVFVRRTTMESFEAPPSHYDAITMFYVLEHLPDPMGALRKAHELLAPGGTLLVRVPHTTPIVRMLSPFGFGASLYDAPYHLYDFSPSVLREMLANAGYAHIRTFPGKPTRPSGILPLAATLLFGSLARGLYAATGGRLLLPGVSKTTIARKPV
ncbi:MAG TPA: class I SAM-dependent methyltransferase [Candidatus Deferrimicrobiaceae bacterium]